MADSDSKTVLKIVMGRPTLPNSSPKRKGSSDEDNIKAPKSKPQSSRKAPKKSKKEQEKEMKLRQENVVMEEASQ
jgi:hypothetical protein